MLGELGRKSFQPGTNRQPAPECKSCEGPSWLRQAAGLWPLLKAQAMLLLPTPHRQPTCLWPTSLSLSLYPTGVWSSEALHKHMYRRQALAADYGPEEHLAPLDLLESPKQRAVGSKDRLGDWGRGSQERKHTKSGGVRAGCVGAHL